MSLYRCLAVATLLSLLVLASPAWAQFTDQVALPVGRSQAVALTDGLGQVHVFGGYVVSTAATTDHLIYSPITQQWTAGAPLARATRAACGAALADGRLMVIAGFDNDQRADAQIFDPVTNQVTLAPAPPVTHGWYCAAGRGRDNRIYVFGGEGARSALSIYDPATNTWSVGASLPSQRHAHGAVPLRDGRFYVFGGFASNALASMDVYDPQANTWVSGPAMPEAKTHFAWAGIYGRAIYVVGGSTEQFNGSPPYTNTVHVFDLPSQSWSTSNVTDLNNRREAFAVSLGTGIHVFGGNEGSTAQVARHTRLGVRANVGLWASDSNQGAVSAALTPRGEWNVTALPPYTGQETVAQINGFDAVLVWTNDGVSNGNHYGNVLAEYVDGGGGVIAMTFSNFANTYDIEGRWRSEGYACEATTGDPYSNGSVDQGSILVPNHPLLGGVTSLSVTDYRTGADLANQSCVRVANFTDGQLFGAANATKPGRTAWLGFWPGSSNEPLWDVLGHSLRWVLGGSGGARARENEAPTVALQPEWSVDEGGEVMLVAQGSDPDEGPQALTYAWDLDGDGQFDDASGEGARFVGVDGPAAVTVMVQVSDGEEVAVASAVVTVNNLPPVSDGIVGELEGFVGEVFVFEAPATDPAGEADALSWTWRFDDNSAPQTGAAVTHVFTRAGIYNVSVEIADEDGGAITRAVEVEVQGLDPMITNVSIPADGEEGELLTFSASANSLRPLTYRWDFGDGADVVEGQEVSHTFGDDGTFFVQLTVIDDEGRMSAVVESVTVLNVAPRVVGLAGDFQGAEGGDFAFMATATDPAGDNDTLTWTWIFGDGSPQAQGRDLSAVNHTYARNGNYLLTLIVSDEDGGTTVTQRTVTVGGQSPTITMLGGDEGGVEGAAVRLVGAATDPGNDPLTWTWDFGDESPVVTGVGRSTVTHTYADDGVYTVTVTVRDDDGEASASREVVIRNAAPTVAVEGPRDGAEGQALRWTARGEDPAGANDPLRYDWSFGDGATATGAMVSHAYADNGTYTVTVTVRDDDGGESSQSVTVSVGNLAPQVVAFSAPGGGAEGQALRFEGQARDVEADTLTWRWEFGDGSPAVVGVGRSSVMHTYADNGEYTVTLTVSDEDGGEAQVPAEVVINNVSPRITSSPPLVALINERYAYAMEAEEPGDDTLTWALLEGPEGLTLSMDGEVSWSAGANLLEEGPFAVEVQVCDEDGGCDTQRWQISTRFEDQDGDGVPDACEVTYGLNPDDPSDGDLDNDQDGINNRDECLRGSDPTMFNGPSAPSRNSPEDGARLMDRTPALVAVNGVDPDGDALVYTFEVYGDADLTALVAASPAVAQGESLTTWEVPFPLPEDGTFWWRVRCADAAANSAWSDVGSFRVDEANAAPAVPALVSPVGDVDQASPALVVAPSVDPEGDAVTYLYEVYGDEALTALVSGGEGEGTSWTVDAALEEDTMYWWRAAARDALGAQSAWSAPWGFVINAANGLPSAPVIESPQEDEVLADVVATLRWARSTDPEGDALTYDVDVATDADFTDLLVAEVAIPEVEGESQELALEGLEAGATYHARVRASDGEGDGEYATVRFSVEAANVAPPLPVLVSPINDARVQRGDVPFVFTTGLDPDGDAVSYVVAVFSDEGLTMPVISTDPLVLGDGEQTVNLTLNQDPGAYFWIVAATDAEGAEAVTAPGAFSLVETANEPPTAPIAVAPVGGAEVPAGELSLVVENATDPDGDALEYTFRVFSDDALSVMVAEVTAVEGDAGQTSAAVTLSTPGTYYWAAFATDAEGAQGPASATASFVIAPQDNNGDPNNGDPNNGDPNNGDPNNGDPNNGDPNNGDPNNGAGPDVSGNVSGGSDCGCATPARPAHTPWLALLATLSLGAALVLRRR